MSLIVQKFVLMPDCQPVREITGYPKASIAIAQSDTEICSPVDKSISISLAEAFGFISSAF